MFIFILVSSLFLDLARSESVFLTGDTQVVLGGTAHIRANVFSGGSLSSGSFYYVWTDSADPPHTFEETTSSPISKWNITYDEALHSPGRYNIKVDVKKRDFIGWWENLPSEIMAINVTSLLDGNMRVIQGETHMKQYVKTNVTAWHNITLRTADEEFLEKKKPHVMTYWFVDCQYMGVQAGLSHVFNYSIAEETHYIEALVVADVLPPTPAPTTTTTTTTASPNATTTTTAATTTSTTSTTMKSPTVLTSTAATHIATPLENWLMGFSAQNVSASVKDYCVNLTNIPTSPSATYGYFRKKLTAKAPVQIVNLNGSNWLQDGDILNVGLTCNGSGPFTYCVQLANGQYNVTNNETCDETKVKPLTDCGLSFSHLFRSPSEYTLVFIISNSVSKSVTPFGINVYKVTKQPQLSVIIVPVVFSILAVISIIFGVAFYFHSRRTFTVEIADFDFGQQTSELEYKTFVERLRESILQSFYRANDPAEADSSWSPSRKYGSMH